MNEERLTQALKDLGYAHGIYQWFLDNLLQLQVARPERYQAIVKALCSRYTSKFQLYMDLKVEQMNELLYEKKGGDEP